MSDYPIFNNKNLCVGYISYDENTSRTTINCVMNIPTYTGLSFYDFGNPISNKFRIADEFDNTIANVYTPKFDIYNPITDYNGLVCGASHCNSSNNKCVIVCTLNYKITSLCIKNDRYEVKAFTKNYGHKYAKILCELFVFVLAAIISFLVMIH
jgi:hypothetical protein